MTNVSAGIERIRAHLLANGFPVEGFSDERIAETVAVMARGVRAEQSSGAVLIAKCPNHGLHGARRRCYVCNGPVEQVPMVPADEVLRLYLLALDAIDRAEIAAEADAQDLRGRLIAFVDDHPWVAAHPEGSGE